jgi:prevent-host-death family protein
MADKSSDDRFSATEAQNNFGEVLRRVAKNEVVYITKYERPTAVVLSPQRYQELIEEDVELRRLEREFDEMLAAMQTEKASRAADELFGMLPAELGEAAVRAAAAVRSAGGDTAAD